MNNTKPLSILFTALFFLGIAGFIAGVAVDNHILRMISKPVPVLVLLLSLKPDTKYKKLIFGGFIFSLLGDILLETAENLFVFGLLSFLIAHIFYITAFLNRRNSKSLITAILLLSFGAGYYYFLFPGLGKMAVPVFIYIVVILTMTWSAFSQYSFNDYSKYAAIGAVFFVFSDSLIAFTKFHSPLPFSRYAIILTYWLAQYLIFYSAKEN